MASEDPTLRLFATGSALAGAVVVMTRPAPSREGVLVGLSCAVGSAAFTVAARSSRRPRRPLRRPLRAAGPPEAVSSAPVPVGPVAPEMRSHRQRVVDRHQRLGARRSTRSE